MINLKVKLFLASFILIFSTTSWGQIVSMTEKKYKDGFQGDISVGFNLVSNNSRTIQSSTQTNLKYSKRLNSYGFSGNYAYSSVDHTQSINDGAFGLIYNYRVPNRLVIAEAFAQYSYNTLQQLNGRILAGGGPRFKIREADNFECTLVAYTVYMSERYSGVLEVNGVHYENLNRSFRFSSMFTLKLKISDNASISNNSYFEPNFSNSNDYRIWSETAMDIKIINHFKFSTNFHLDYKSIIPDGVNNLSYKFINSLKYTF